MDLLWLFVVAVGVCVVVLVWLERRDDRALRDHLRRRFPIRLSNSFWGELNGPDESGPEPPAAKDDRRPGEG
ncbi:MAG TPA: hypothetical protein VIP10_04805 [Burkholderiaceae bacterium]